MLYVVQITTSTISQLAWSKLINMQFDLVEDLMVLSGEWVASNGTSVDSVLRRAVSADGTKLLATSAESKAAFVVNAWVMAAWQVFKIINSFVVLTFLKVFPVHYIVYSNGHLATVDSPPSHRPAF